MWLLDSDPGTILLLFIGTISTSTTSTRIESCLFDVSSSDQSCSFEQQLFKWPILLHRSTSQLGQIGIKIVYELDVHPVELFNKLFYVHGHYSTPPVFWVNNGFISSIPGACCPAPCGKSYSSPIKGSLPRSSCLTSFTVNAPD